jgi:uncharacterized protein YndB with AHSA1/START domain
MARAEQSKVIERPPGDVFAYLTDPARIHEWQASALEGSQESPGPMAVGTRVREVRKFLGKRMDSVVEVTEYLPPEKFSLRVVSGPIRFDVRQAFTPTDGGTKIDVVIEGEPGGFFALAEPLVVRAVGRELGNNLATAKDILEADGVS